MRTSTSFTLGQAAKATGKNKTTILRAVKDGRISAGRDEANQYVIEPAELFRVFPAVAEEGVAQPAATTPTAPLRNDAEQPVATAVTGYRLLAEELRRQLDEARQERERERGAHQVAMDDLRRRLDTSEEERRRKDQQLTALLTDQRQNEEKAAQAAISEAAPKPKGFMRRLFGTGS